MNELFQELGNSIFTFKSGDYIYRTKSAEVKKSVYNDNLMIEVEVTAYTDSSFRRSPIEFVCIKNNQIYLRNVIPDYSGKKRVSSVLLEYYSENWALFEIPEGLTIEDCVDPC